MLVPVRGVAILTDPGRVRPPQGRAKPLPGPSELTRNPCQAFHYRESRAVEGAEEMPQAPPPPAPRRGSQGSALEGPQREGSRTELQEMMCHSWVDLLPDYKISLP